MKLRSQFKAANSSGSFWAEIRGGGAQLCLRRSRRLCPALKPASRDVPELPPSGHCRKRKVGGNSLTPEEEAKKPRKEEEDGFPAPANSGVSGSGREGSEGDLIDAAESDSGFTEDSNEAVRGEQDKETPPPPICGVCTEEQGKKITADTETEDGISGEDKGGNDGVLGEQHNETTTLSPSILEVSEAEKEGCTERVIPTEEEICVVNRSPTYSDVSIDNDRAEMEEDSEETTNSAAVEEEIIELTPPPPSNFWDFEAEKNTEQVNFSDSFMCGPQLHFALEKGDGGRVNCERSVLKVRDFAAVNTSGGNDGGGGWMPCRRTEIFAGMDYGRVEVVCLYEPLSLPFG